MSLSIRPIENMPKIVVGDDIAKLIIDRSELLDGDIVVVTSKIVAKAQGRVVEVDKSDAGARKDLILSESVRVLRQRGDLFITETIGGFICANAGIDWSNVEPGCAVLLPTDPDGAAHDIRNIVRARVGKEIGVVITDTFGRAWREGVVDVALGCAGVAPVLDLSGTEDGYGVTLHSTRICIADEIAAAAELVMGKSALAPAAIIRGAPPSWLGTGSIKADVLRHPNNDMFR